mmetsp:Transcript_12264/g.23762  ORF Transcript_12264/g.23762 Transcript_12264/m.23762 type:complete len:346 (+) Transcript_12264:390-1427(+)
MCLLHSKRQPARLTFWSLSSKKPTAACWQTRQRDTTLSDAQRDNQPKKATQHRDQNTSKANRHRSRLRSFSTQNWMGHFLSSTERRGTEILLPLPSSCLHFLRGRLAIVGSPIGLPPVCEGLSSLLLLHLHFIVSPQHRRLLGGVHSHLSKLDGSLKKIVVTLGLGLGLHPVLSPHIDAVPPYEHSLGLGVLRDGLPEGIGEVALIGGVLNNGHDHFIIEFVSGNSLHHFQAGHLEFRCLLIDHSCHHSVQRMRVHHGSRPPDFISCHEQGGTLGELQSRALGRFSHGAVRIQHEDVFWFHPLLLHTRRSHIDRLPLLYRDPASCSRGPTEVVEDAAELADPFLG